jgi:hypothetical protein
VSYKKTQKNRFLKYVNDVFTEAFGKDHGFVPNDVFECETKLDTLYYKSFNPLEYDKNRDYYWSRDKLVEEGIRRNQDDLKELAKVQTLLDNETDEENKKNLQDELDLFKWRDSIFKQTDTNTGLSRDKRDIITDYYPDEIGLQRPWIERHSHIPDYSY